MLDKSVSGRPSRIDPFEDLSSIFNGTVHEKSFRHARFVRVQIDEPPRSKKRCSEQDGKFTVRIVYLFETDSSDKSHKQND
jgi:hypothetical protein